MTRDRHLLVADFAQAILGGTVRSGAGWGAGSDRFTGEEHQCAAISALPAVPRRQAVRLDVFCAEERVVR